MTATNATISAASLPERPTIEQMIKFSDVEKTFTSSAKRGHKNTENRVLGGLTFSITQGEFVSVIGPSGGGKTTLLNLLAGLSAPTGGQITVSGVPVTGPGADRGVVFQQDAIFPWRNVRKNVEYGLERAKVPRTERRQRAQRYIDMVGLSEAVDLLPKQLSGGMKKRVAIAAVLASGPDVLLMDEPFGALDYSTRIRLQDELLRVWAETQVTTVFVTHDIEEALYLSDRILVLANGGLVEDFRVDFPRPRNSDVRMGGAMQEAKKHLWGYL